VYKSIVKSVVKKSVYSDRITAVKLKEEPVNILRVQVYMPTSDYEYDEVEELYDIIEEILEEDGKGVTNTIIMGDWKSVVGDKAHHNAVGPYAPTNNTKKEYLESICDDIIEFQRTGRYDLMYMKTKELGWKENHRIQNIGIENSRGNMIIDQRQVLQILENYITELYDRANRPEHLEVKHEAEVDEDKKDPYIVQS
jgi:hypothetical protein